MKGKGSAAVAVELPAPGLDRRVQVRASLGPLLRVPFGPLLLLLGRREGSPTAAVLAARDCILGLLRCQSDWFQGGMEADARWCDSGPVCVCVGL